MEEKGVWRTIRGRKVFIKDGESPIDAFNRFYKNNKNIDPSFEINSIGEYKKYIENGKLVNDDGSINKKVALYGTNPDRFTNSTGNCQLCVPTYLERLRGNDVIANPKDESIYKDWYKYYKGVESLSDWTRTTNSSGVRQITKDIKEAGDGAVFEIYFVYNERSKQKGAHVFTGRNEKGKVIFENPQGVTTEFAENRIDYLTQMSRWGKTRYLRIDDKELKDEYKEKIYRKRK